MKENSLSKSLSQFISTEVDDAFSNPYTDDENIHSVDMDSVIQSSKEKKEERKKDKKKQDKFSKIMSKGESLIDEIADEDFIDDFDGFVGNYMLEDEDVELKRNLVRYGRKYARDTKVSGESSEIAKAYSESEKLLSELLDEIDTDKELVQKDIVNMRMMRTRNYKALSDLIESKAQFHNTALSVIKEMNSMKKSQFDLQMKVDKSKKEAEEDDSSSNKAIQQLFGIGRGNLMDSLGGYSGVSGALQEEDDIEIFSAEEDEAIHNKYFSNEDDTENDGDKFLKYEGAGVHYVLMYDDDNYREIIAEDKDGNIVPDYPLPSDPDNLTFRIDESTQTATDNLTNNYDIRHV